VSAGFEYLTALGDDDTVTAGSAWVDASVQRVGVHGFPFGEPQGLAAWDNERYGTLSVLDDDASFDIFTQVARAVGPRRGAEAVDPMGGLEVRHLVAFGGSQSANRLATYYNAIQPLAGEFDAVVLAVYSGCGTRVDAAGRGTSLAEIPPEGRAIQYLLPFGSHLLRDDIGARVLVLNSETEAGWFQPARQPDSDTFRLWEVAGTAHLGSVARDDDSAAGMLRDMGGVLGGAMNIPQPNPNVLTFDPVTNAALHHLQAWVRSGTPPPPQDRIDFAGDPPQIVRDGDGNALGGIRLPEMEVPTATHVGASPAGVPDLIGWSTPFAPETVRALYADEADFRARFDAAVAHGVERGYVLPHDADRLRQRASFPTS
jgi:hypothetical protein